MSDEFGLEAYLFDHIPLSRHLGVRVQHASTEEVRVTASLAPNLNHRKTGFGGSISAVAILAGWGLLWCRLNKMTTGHNIVIQRNSIDYLVPVTADFTATCKLPTIAEWERFQRVFEQRGRSRIQLDATVHVGETLAATLTGLYVALREPGGAGE